VSDAQDCSQTLLTTRSWFCSHPTDEREVELLKRCERSYEHAHTLKHGWKRGLEGDSGFSRAGTRVLRTRQPAFATRCSHCSPVGRRRASGAGGLSRRTQPTPAAPITLTSIA
jgi:hypothetical protein